jgi:hypothetical protein
MLPTLDRIYWPVRQENSALGENYDPKKFSHFGSFVPKNNNMIAHLGKNHIFFGILSILKRSALLLPFL